MSWLIFTTTYNDFISRSRAIISLPWLEYDLLSFCAFIKNDIAETWWFSWDRKSCRGNQIKLGSVVPLYPDKYIKGNDTFDWWLVWYSYLFFTRFALINHFFNYITTLKIHLIWNLRKSWSVHERLILTLAARSFE